MKRSSVVAALVVVVLLVGVSLALLFNSRVPVDKGGIGDGSVPATRNATPPPDEPLIEAGTEDLQPAAEEVTEPALQGKPVPAPGLEQPPRAVDADTVAEQLRSIQRYRDAYRARTGQDGGYERLLTRLFGQVPANPIAALSGLDESALAELLRQNAEPLGEYLPSNVALGDALGWFEEAGASSDIDGQIQAMLLRRVVQHNAAKLRKDPRQAKRVLALLDAQLAAWHGSPAHLVAGLDLIRAFHEICPVEGGLELIRRWTVETPHGHTTIEAKLAEALKFWPLVDCRLVALEVLGTRRTGAINGIINAWYPRIDGGRIAWKDAEFRSVLVPAIAEAVAETKSTWAIITALVAKDLLEGRAADIARALFARRDSTACTAYGFSFLNKAGREEEAQSTWKDWLWSHDPYRAESACVAVNVSGMKPASESVEAMNRMLELAMNDANGSALRAAAAIALSFVDRTTRSPAVLERWVADTEIEDERLIALGRGVRRMSVELVQSVLEARINDVAGTPEQRHYPLFLLAIRHPVRALELCEQDLDRDSRWFSNHTILLAGAAAEAVAPNKAAQRASALRLRIPDPEPDWMRAIRLRLTSENRRAEHRAVG